MSIRTLLVLLIASSVPGLAPYCGGPKNWIRLDPNTLTPSVNDIVDVGVRLDFPKPTFGGGVQVEYDASRFSFLDFTFDAGLGNEPEVTIQCPNASDPRCDAFAPGTTAVLVAFGTTQAAGLQGNRAIGTLRLRALAAGSTQVKAKADDGLAGKFVSSTSFIPMGVRYETENFTIN